jgi:hypothetical protein
LLTIQLHLCNYTHQTSSRKRRENKIVWTESNAYLNRPFPLISCSFPSALNNYRLLRTILLCVSLCL